MRIPTILIIAHAVESPAAAYEAFKAVTTADKTAHYGFATHADTLLWVLYDPSTELSFASALAELSAYDMIAVTSLQHFEFMTGLKAKPKSVLKAPIVWLGSNHRPDQWEGFESWARNPRSLDAIKAARDYR
jgi:hypothetical protein